MTRRLSAKFGGLILSLAFLSGISGCAVRTEVQKVDVGSLKGSLRFENVFFKEFTKSATAEPPGGTLAVCQESGIAYLREKGVFRQVDRYREGIGTASTALVEAELLEIRIVSSAARFWGGALAGRSHMKMDVRIVDAASGEILARQELMGAPDAMGSAWSFGTTDQKLPAAMGGLIGDFVLANAGKK
ncbi:MAG TPA: DUF4410 domain-containing protein [Candidatus Deferrimicrobiaceae bacterium]